MSSNIAQLEGSAKVRTAEFVKLIIPDDANSPYTFSTSFRHEVVDGFDYSPLSGLLTIGEQHRDLRATSFDTTISLTGVDPVRFGEGNVYMVLATQIRGASVEIYRGFYDENYALVNFVQRFKGIVTSYNVAEDRHENDDIFNIILTCSSYKRVLENNIGGRKTNSVSMKSYFSTDTSFDRIEKLAGAYFDFGQKPTPKTAATSVVDPGNNNSSGGGGGGGGSDGGSGDGGGGGAE
jgi:uncharacterized membrane protein YgcG